MNIVNLTQCSGKHRALLLLLSLLFFSLCYGYTNYAASQLNSSNKALWLLDTWQVFVPWMIIPYASSILCYCAVFFYFKGVAHLRRLLAKLTWAVFLASLFFLLYPLKFSYQLPAIDNQFLAQAYSLLHFFDQPFNQAPSLHVIFAIIFCSEISKVTSNSIVQKLAIIWCALIVLSTWFTYQHHSIDIVTGIVIGVLLNVSIKQTAHYVSSIYLMLGTLCLLALHAMRDSHLVWLILFAYLALSLFLTSISYYLNKPAWLGKKQGRLQAKSWLLFAPFLLGYQLTWWLNNCFAKDPQSVVKVCNNLWLGPKLDNSAQRLLPENTWLFDLSAELSEQQQLLKNAVQNTRYRQHPLLDLQAPSEAQLVLILRDLVACLTAAKQEFKGQVYLHCAMGYSRCYLVACLYLMLKQGYSPIEAKAYLSSMSTKVTLGDQYLSDAQLYSVIESYTKQSVA